MLTISRYDTGTISGVKVMGDWLCTFGHRSGPGFGNCYITTSEESLVVYVLSFFQSSHYRLPPMENNVLAQFSPLGRSSALSWLLLSPMGSVEKLASWCRASYSQSGWLCKLPQPTLLFSSSAVSLLASESVSFRAWSQCTRCVLFPRKI